MTAQSFASPDVHLSVEDLKKHFPLRHGFGKKSTALVKAVDEVSFQLCCGETLGMVGESGCGKTTVGRCIVRAYTPTAGRILYRESAEASVDLAKIPERGLKDYRRQIRMIFQDPYSSLNPRMKVMDIVGLPLKIHGIAHGSELEDRVASLLSRVGLQPEYMRRYPHAFSGGQRQRIGIARALALDPKILVCDEPVSALDVSVQAQILNLLQDLRDELDLTYLFISHDLSVVEYVAQRVAVMYVGKLVEISPKAALFASPRHPYTEALLSAAPLADPRRRAKRILLEGDVADPADPPPGCAFHPRCRYCADLCKTITPKLTEVEANRWVACHLARDLSLRGIEA